MALAAAKALQSRDLETLSQLYHRDISFEWPMRSAVGAGKHAT